jgi:hypothetical protein
MILYNVGKEWRFASSPLAPRYLPEEIVYTSERNLTKPKVEFFESEASSYNEGAE